MKNLFWALAGAFLAAAVLLVVVVGGDRDERDLVAACITLMLSVLTIGLVLDWSINRRRPSRTSPRPLVLCIDNSGSMHGEPTAWAKRLTEELLARCRKAGRTLHVLHYDHLAPVATTYPGGRGTLFWPPVCNGGTRFDLVLTEAMQLAIPGGHIMFVTDGMADVSDEWLASFNHDREEHGVQVDSWQIASTDDPRWTKHLLKFSRNATPIPLTTDPAAVANKAQEA